MKVRISQKAAMMLMADWYEQEGIDPACARNHKQDGDVFLLNGGLALIREAGRWHLTRQDSLPDF